MTPFLAIVKLTCRSAVRSNVFRFLLFLLIICVILVPNTLKGDGTAQGYLQVMLEYSTAFVALILSTSILWMACSEFCTDIENGQLHMIFVKPISRITVWLGKFTGVFLIHFVLLVISFVFIYGFLMFQYSRQKFTPAEREKMQNEVFAGRRAFTPYLGDLEKQVQDELARRIETAKKLGETLPDLDGAGRRKFLHTIRMEILARMGEVPPGKMKTWFYTGLPKEYNGPVYIGYKIYSGNIGSKNQKIGSGFWFLRYVQRIYDDNVKDKDGKPVLKETREVPLQRPPEQILTSSYTEFAVPGDALIYDGTASIGFANLQEAASEVMHFQVTESPRLLIRETSFVNNYFRAMLAIAMGIFALGMIASSFAAFLSMPTAVFITLSYLLVGLFSSYLITTIEATGGEATEVMDKIGMALSSLMMSFLIPIQSFFVSGFLSTGTLIEYSYLANLLVFNIILKGLPLCIFGIWLYWRRETALAMKE
ncbi:MAG: ABC transporter permease [Lentisphaeria bacterium]|nr:ABC transporter permease [Lentisphaeria bacterium]